MNYRTRRSLKKLSRYTVAKNLGVDYDKYVEVERGKRPLEKQYVDKFQEILANASEIKLAHSLRMGQVKEAFKNGTLRKKINEYGYTYSTLAKELGLTQGSISNAFSGNPRLTSDDTMERIYDFLNEPFNKQIGTTTEERKKGRRTRACAPEVEKWFRENNLKEVFTNAGYTSATFANKLGVSEGHISNVLKDKRNLSGALKTRIYEMFNTKDNKNERESVEIVPETLETSETPNTICYVETENGFEPLSEDTDIETKPTLEEQLDALLRENTRLKSQIDAYVKLIEKI